MVPIVRVAPAALAALIASCGLMTEPEPVERLRVSVSIDTHAIAAGDTAHIRVVAANDTRKTISFGANSCVLMFSVVDPTGERAHVSPQTCMDYLEIVRVPAGETIERTVPFDGHTQRIRRGYTRSVTERVALPPGEYRVYGSLTADLRNPSAPAALRILAPDPE